jgi:streptogramin lyase
MRLCNSALLDRGYHTTTAAGDAVGLSSNQQDSSTTATTCRTLTEPSLTTLIGIDDGIVQERYDQWCSFVDGGDGFLYGIPSNARRVVKYNPLDKSLTEIGPDLGNGGYKWACGVRANNGKIYCAPYDAEHILKIDPIQGTVETLDDVELPETELPETGNGYLWASGALAQDNYIYYMPFDARRIMRLNPDNDSLTSVGDDLGEQGFKYIGTVVGNDDCVYGIPHEATRIIKFDPTNPDTTSTVGEEAEEGEFECDNGVLGGDGNIYAVNRYGQILQIDTTSNNYTWIGDRIYSGYGPGWGHPIVGADKCIYWPPSHANRVLKFDPETQQLPSLVGDDLGEGWCLKWQGGALATDGVIYCFPDRATQVLAIDPFKEMLMTLKNNFRQHPQELGLLFVKDEECNETFYCSAVRKFGIEKVFKSLIEECLPADGEWADSFSGSYFPLFMVAASCKNSAVSVIYHLLRRNVHDALSGNDVGVSKKRKLNST